MLEIYGILFGVNLKPKPLATYEEKSKTLDREATLRSGAKVKQQHAAMIVGSLAISQHFQYLHGGLTS
jgi:hypothetical protein